MSRHKSITMERILELAEADDNLGLCANCGEEVSGVEPDARKYTCEFCDEPRVYGVEAWILMA